MISPAGEIAIRWRCDEESFDCVPDSGFLTTDFQGDQPGTGAISVPTMGALGLLLLVIPRLRS